MRLRGVLVVHCLSVCRVSSLLSIYLHNNGRGVQLYWWLVPSGQIGISVFIRSIY